jgi:type III restriction enzyme
MESETAKTALRSLHPLFALRYSATPRISPNLVYRLTPFEAFRRNLVKKIQVSGVTKKDDLNQPFLALTKVSRNGRITAKVRTYVDEKGQTREAQFVLHQHDDLHKITRRDEFKDKYRVVEINAADEFLLFENGLKLKLNETIGSSRPEIFRLQIETIRTHMERQEELYDRGVKVLSLFFIDRVANYTDENGIIKQLFDRAFNEIKKQYPHFKSFQPEQARDAYFAKMKFGKGDEKAIDIENLEKAPAVQREAAQKSFELIMKRKERLLSFDEPVSFIFAHSALKEGWDNPNVFQICTLNQAVSEIRRRQEIGRGLRLCVNQQGLRLLDEEVNTLTVIANESYVSYAANLQQEYVKDNMAAPPPPSEVRKKNATRNDKIFHGSREFKDFWEKLSQKVSYRAHIDTSELIRTCIERLNAQAIPEPVLVIERGKFLMKEYTLRLESVRQDRATVSVGFVDSDNQVRKNYYVLQAKSNLARVSGDERLRHFQVLEIHNGRKEPKVIFANNVELTLNTTKLYSSQVGQVLSEEKTALSESKYPVFNLLDRAARELGLTRPTLNAIFKGLHDVHKKMLFRNPEGFTGIFIQQIKEALADHIAERIEFIVEDGRIEYNLERLFPLKKAFAQKELEEADERALYYLQTDSEAGRKFVVQTDSEVERKFVKRVKPDDNIVFYFKFPASFRIKLPKIIGDYNPDWGLMRRDENGKFVLQLIRETKFTTEAHLHFPHEKRKVACARKHFRSMNIDYRPIFPDFAEWWRSENEVATQALLEIGTVEKDQRQPQAKSGALGEGSKAAA